MNHSKAVLSALLFTLSVSGASVLHAASNVDDESSAIATDSPSNLQNRSVEELVAIAKAGESNETIKDAVLNNDAINGAILGNDAINQSTANYKTEANVQATAQPPVRSSAEGVDADKLILNEPVVDQANILNPQEKLRLESQLRGIYQQGLAQAAVVIVPTTNGVPIFDYALQVAEKWELGDEAIDDGLLMVVAVNDRDMYILTGYGLEGVLPDAALNRIIREDITPLFKQNNYGAGILAGIGALNTRLTADPEVLARADEQAAERTAQQGSNELPSPTFLFIMALVFGGVITSIFGRVFGSTITAGGFFVGSLALGGSFIMTSIMTIFIWLFLIFASGGGGGKGGGKRRRRGGMVFLPGMGGGSSSGGGGFGGGGFGGGGGGFGGGGAGGSW
ncbi:MULTISPECIES: TPM domain-containing protein [unclassified Psychrobacter]|uniref:TPM domain-containing protein n=1 Tax=unclassified Psychrobacter TaxID=196806 RepID=UPI0025B46172|nr:MULTISPECIES: TPM domain-containing protein [unclassified Psychrobacter]MDN3452267.1 TPM domain-containing protein [Psychrobacter sp. APC 3350]MDN3502104.1 TPM domain-containing protein [Psychrobacter sp. 5A.1]